VIEFNRVTKIYKKTFTAVKDINLKINQGEFIFIVGKSGDGQKHFDKALVKRNQSYTGNNYI